MRDEESRARPGGTATVAARTVSRIGFGAARVLGRAGDPSAAADVLRRAVELGVDHIDTAQFYGNGAVNETIRAALHPYDGILLATKVGAAPDPGAAVPLRAAQKPDELRAALEDNLRSLGVEQVPLVYLRRLEIPPGISAVGDQRVPLDDQLAELVRLRDEGLVGALGISNIRIDTLRRALPAGIAAVQNAYSVVDRQHEESLALCAEHGIAWVPYFPLGGAFPGYPKAADAPAVRRAADRLGVGTSAIALAWLLRHAPHTLLIPGTSSISHLEQNLSVSDVVLDPATVADLDSIDPANEIT